MRQFTFLQHQCRDVLEEASKRETAVHGAASGRQGRLVESAPLGTLEADCF
jgi:hypothetical protein